MKRKNSENLNVRWKSFELKFKNTYLTSGITRHYPSEHFGLETILSAALESSVNLLFKNFCVFSEKLCVQMENRIYW